MFLKTTLGKTDYPLYKGKDKIKLRYDLNKKFNVNVLNMGDVPMGEELMLNLYAREVGANPYTLKKSGGTPRLEGIKLKDCIPFWCKIETPEFNKFLDNIKHITIKGEKGEFQQSVLFHNYKFDFGLGGSHGSAKPKVWDTNDEWIIVDYDIGLIVVQLKRK